MVGPAIADEIQRPAGEGRADDSRGAAPVPHGFDAHPRAPSAILSAVRFARRTPLPKESP
jgi:hypothetical protein